MSSTSAVDTSIQTVSAALDSADCAIIASEAGRGIWTSAGCLPASHTLYLPGRFVKQFVRSLHERTVTAHLEKLDCVIPWLKFCSASSFSHAAPAIQMVAFHV